MDKAAIETTLEGLRAELDRCPATPAGYSEANNLRNRIRLYEAALPDEVED